jgi:hypothetical protein
MHDVSENYGALLEQLVYSNTVSLPTKKSEPEDVSSPPKAIPAKRKAKKKPKAS